MPDTGIELVTKAMEAWQHHEGVQCNCCLAIMALVRGTGSVCQVMLKPRACSGPIIPPSMLTYQCQKLSVPAFRAWFPLVVSP